MDGCLREKNSSVVGWSPVTSAELPWLSFIWPDQVEVHMEDDFTHCLLPSIL